STRVAEPCQLAARSRLPRNPRIKRAPSARSREAKAVPSPPVPPASTISLPRRESGNRGALSGGKFFRNEFGLEREVAACYHDQKHGQHFAVAEIVLEESCRQSRQKDGDAGMQQESAVIAAGRQGAEPAQEVPADFEEHPHQHEHRGDSTLGGELKIDVVQ